MLPSFEASPGHAEDDGQADNSGDYCGDDDSGADVGAVVVITIVGVGDAISPIIAAIILTALAPAVGVVCHKFTNICLTHTYISSLTTFLD